MGEDGLVGGEGEHECSFNIMKNLSVILSEDIVGVTEDYWKMRLLYMMVLYLNIVRWATNRKVLNVPNSETMKDSEQFKLKKTSKK